MSTRSGPLPAAGYYEPSLAHQLLPRCGVCGGKHPRAFRPAPADLDYCPDCGARVAGPPAPVVVPAVLTGFHPITLWARFCFWAARRLSTLAERI